MKVIVALDESPFSRIATESVAQRLWPTGTEFLLCTVLDADKWTSHEGIQTVKFQESKKLWCQQTLKYLDEQAYELKQLVDGCSVRFDVMTGNIAEEISLLANNWPADVIVVGSHGRQGVRRYVLGSVAEAIVDLAPCDVEVIKSRKLIEGAEPDDTNIDQNRILICVDGSPESIASLEWVMKAEWTPTQEFTIMSVISPLENTSLSASRFTRIALVKATHLNMMERIESDLREYTGILQVRFPKNKIQYEIQEGSTDDCILSFAEQWKASLIVLGAHSQQLPIELSVARKVAGASKCSVKIINCRRPPSAPHQVAQQVHSQT